MSVGDAVALEPDHNHIAIAGLEAKRPGHLHKSAGAQNKKNRKHENKAEQSECRSGAAMGQ